MKPRSVEIRSYQVGFGDCFLLSFVYDENDKRHVLIDFGTTALPGKAKRAVHMRGIADAVATVIGSGKRLTAVVATHRHADHISGFGVGSDTGESGKVIAALRPRLVLQPWTEDPKARVNATQATRRPGTNKSFVSSLATMNAIAGHVLALANKKPAWMSAAMRRELEFLGSDNIANKSAVQNLIAMGDQRGAKAIYLRHGDKTGLETLLPGVTVRVLGPPDLTQTQGIRQMRSRDRDQFWHFVSRLAAPIVLAPRPTRARKFRQMPVPANARWFRDRLEHLGGQSILEIVRQLDQQMNNTSLILLFEVNGKKLLFPGDAQLENWNYALTEAKDSKGTRALLAGVDFYKVGHHGSLNATPRKLLWEAFEKRKDRKLLTMISTMSGKHGKPAKKTEVPRSTLIKALQANSKLKDTRTLKRSNVVHVHVL